MDKFTLIFKESIKRTPTVESFRFKSESPVNFLPGQFAQIIFDKEDKNNYELNKYLSFSSAPGKEYVEFTKRLSGSTFSGKLKDLKKGDIIIIDGPMGRCVLKDEFKRIGFLIGGIGVTPVISIIEYAMDKKLDTDICLIYANKSEAEIAYRQELDKWSGKNPSLDIKYFVQACDVKSAACYQGAIDLGAISEHMSDYRDRVLFAFGPPAMVNAMIELCSELGCDKDKLWVENFIGY
ncbi:MAG: FAD-dependent oxidoreductase [Candidatus Kaelpia aquatica]|nr:FAD-dependent oxidoreductase [Candidatus Kaelpia aquatica]